MPERRPTALIAGDDAAANAEADRLRADKYSVQQGFALPEDPWELAGDRRVCVGAVADEAGARAALLAAVRGVDLVLTVDLPDPARPAFLADLGRVTELRAQAPDAPTTALPLDESQLQLLRLVGDGRTTAEAAAELYLSLRTAERKLGAARRALGVATTAEAVARVRQQYFA